MKIGIDFDNTIVCYDHAFHIAALERGWIDDGIPATKEAVKSHLRGQGRNDDWTELQGYVYGPGIMNGGAFAGFQDFLIQANEDGWEPCVVSHKTEFPYLGPRYDLHGAARAWIEESGLLANETGLSQENLFFETTKEAKLARAAELQVDVFVDDLPEILEHADFPPLARPILFDPNNAHPTSRHIRLPNWEVARELILNLQS